MLIPRKTAPSGLPRCRSVVALALSEEPASLESDVFSRKSCVMATPIEANESDVLSQARNVRSAKVSEVSESRTGYRLSAGGPT